MLDLKAKLAAAGVVSKEQVDKFDAKQAKEKAKRKAKAQKHKKPGGKQGANNKGGKGQGTKSSGVRKDRPVVNVKHLKTLKRGEAYTRLRRVVVQNRLDEEEKAIPSEDEKPFNFVRPEGKIGKLYLKQECIDSLRNGKAAISSFMSHHGLAHCVLPKEIALAISEVFPLWLRHLEGHDKAGLLESDFPEEMERKKAKQARQKARSKGKSEGHTNAETSELSSKASQATAETSEASAQTSQLAAEASQSTAETSSNAPQNSVEQASQEISSEDDSPGSGA